jgi:hypothetical protein
VAEEHLTPTQRVVTTLLTLLPLAVYHVFLDNLFASVKLFKALRSSQVGATGTCRKDSGVDELPCSTHLPVIPTYRSAKKKIPHTKCPTSLAQCLAKIEVIYMEQIVSY